jgi:ferrous iron transport protein B
VILSKTWYRLKDFLLVAFPVIIVGSLVMGWLYETHLMWRLTGPLHLVVESWLGLPPIAGLCLLFAILRKEMALQLLVSLAIIQHGAQATNLLTFMTKEQLFIFALVNALNIPCVATISVLARELGWRRATAISLFDVALAVTVGGLAHQALRTLA